MVGRIWQIDGGPAASSLLISSVVLSEIGSMLYIGGIVAFLDSSATTVFRSMISKAVEEDEIGKIFSVVGLFHAVMPFVTGPIFGYLYSTTVKNQSNAFLFLLIGTKFILFMLVILIRKSMRKEVKL